MRYQSPNLPEIRHLLSGLQEGAGTHRAPGKLRTRSSEERAELRQIFLARALDKQHAAAYNQEMQVELHSRKRKENRAFFNTIDPHQTPVINPDSSAPVRMTFLHGPGS